MGLFKRKEEKATLTQDEARKIGGRAEVLMMAIRQLYTDLYFGYITKEEFDAKKAEIDEEYIGIIEIAKGERNERTKKVFDKLMGDPIPWLDEIFNSGEGYNKRVHDAIGEVENESNPSN